MGRSPESARSLSRLERLLIYHDLLLRDSIRNRAFRRALAARVAPGASVLDIGAGTGLWAIEAARRGARQVVAIEKEPLLASLIERLAAENGVADRVRVVRGDSRRIALPRQFDLVVSETVGNLGFDEGVLELVADAQARFLRPGGAVIPHVIALMAAPRTRAGALRCAPKVFAPSPCTSPASPGGAGSVCSHLPRPSFASTWAPFRRGLAWIWTTCARAGAFPPRRPSMLSWCGSKWSWLLVFASPRERGRPGVRPSTVWSPWARGQAPQNSA